MHLARISGEVVELEPVALEELDQAQIARAMGWTVCKLRGDEHSYNRENPKNHELVVCRPAWRDRVLAALASCGALEA